MISFNSSNVQPTAAAADSLLQLLAIIADPERARKFLVHLKVVLDDAGRDAARLEAERHHAEIAAQQKVNADRREQLDRYAIDLGDMANRLAEREQALAAKMERLRALTAPAAA